MFEPHAIYAVKRPLIFSNFKRHNGTWSTVPQLKINEVQVPGFKDDYDISVKESFDVTIKASHPRGFLYAKRYLAEQIESNKTLMVGKFHGRPSFFVRGIIEGFYGEPWSHDDRLDMLAFCNEFNLNTYMYAPKDDHYHRDLWRTPYPHEIIKQIHRYIQKAQDYFIDFYFCISPGKDFRYNVSDDIQALNLKIKQILNFGVRHFCLLMDDIDYNLVQADEKIFQTPGRAHAYIANTLYQYLCETVESPILVLCPTEYWQNYDTPYRQDIKNNLNPAIKVFWTGFNTIAEYIPNEDGVTVQKAFNHSLILWDNYPVNDVSQDMIYLGPLVNRGPNLYQTHEGMVANPMIQWHLSKPALITMADYMWNAHSYTSEKSYEKALKKLAKNDDSTFEDLKKVSENFRYSIIRYDTIEVIEHYIITGNISELVKYYQDVLESIERLRLRFDSLFMAQWDPWLQRFKWDYELLLDIARDDHQQIQSKIQLIKDFKHTTGTNFVVKLAIKLGFYEGPLYPNQRANFWEGFDA
jgi:hyaluronoglucosaminidase